MNSVGTDIDFVDVPHFEEILEYLPIASNDKEDVMTYIQNIKNLVNINYRYEQYQFAYFGVHLLYMTYIYCSAWKISSMCVKRYKDAIIFARPYNGKEVEFRDSESLFKFSLLSEKDIGKIFHLTGLDVGQIRQIAGFVGDRDDMAHASGKISIPNAEEFETKAKTVLTSMSNIHNSMKGLVRKWFGETLIKFSQDSDGNFDIYENVISDYSLSIKEIAECDEMSVKGILVEHPSLESELKSYKKDLRDFIESYFDTELL